MLATQLTTVAMDEARVISAGSIRILGIIVSNDTNAAITAIFKNAAAATILTIRVGADTSIEYSAQWIADGGLNIPTLGDADVIITIAHGAPGA